MRILNLVALIGGLGIGVRSPAADFSDFCYRGLASLSASARYLKPVSEAFYGRHASGRTLPDVPNPSVVKNMFSPWFLIAKDPQVDPVLYHWLERVKAKHADITDPLERAARLCREVRTAFPFDNFNPRHPILTATLATGTGNQIVKLGDFISAGTGVCRHQAILLQLALQDAGISSQVVYGEVKQIDSHDGELIQRKYHAWVQVQTPHGYFAFDPGLGPQGQLVRAGSPFVRKGIERILKSEYHFEPQGGGALNGPRALDEAGMAELRQHFPGLGESKP